MKEFLKRFAIYIALISCAFLAFIYGLPYLYQILPNDYSRHKVIIDVLSDESLEPKILLFGDSRTYHGINAKTLTNNLPGNPLAFNLGSSAQGLMEGTYFLAQVPKSVNDVLHCIAYQTLSLDSLEIPVNKALSMRLYGYQLDSETAKLIDRVNPWFYKDIAEVSFKARNSVIKSSLHYFVRKAIDVEKFDNNFHDLYFPHLYTTLRNPTYKPGKKNLACNFPGISNTVMERINRTDSYFKNRNVNYHIVLMPVNPEVCNIDSVTHASYLNSVRSSLNSHIIDLTLALRSEEFYDDVHPNRLGAEKISKIIAEQLNAKSE